MKMRLPAEIVEPQRQPATWSSFSRRSPKDPCWRRSGSLQLDCTPGLISEPISVWKNHPVKRPVIGPPWDVSLQNLNYKFLTDQLTRSFCEGIFIGPTARVKMGAATLTLKTTPLCLMKALEIRPADFRPVDSRKTLSEPGKGRHNVRN